MADKVALIVGGARGIGRSAGITLASQGWSIATCYRKSENEARDLTSELKGKGVNAITIQSDVSDPDNAQQLVQQVEEKLGRIDALLNCAGPYHRVDLMEETAAGWNEMFDNNLHPVFYLSRAVAKGMRERKWGRIINFGMANADQHNAQTAVTAHYIAKAGVLMLTRALAKSLAPHGITVNSISPGFVDSGSAPAEELQKMVKNIPAGYVGTTSDAVSAISFLLSDEARYITGSNIHLSGGWGI